MLASSQRLIDGGETFESALRAGLRAVLCAPEFLFLNEPLADGRRANRRLRHRLAAVVFFVEHHARRGIARSGRSRAASRARRAAAASRAMLASPKAAAFTNNFTGQWLKLRQIARKRAGPDALSRIRRAARILDGRRDAAILRRSRAAELERDGIRRFRLGDSQRPTGEALRRARRRRGAVSPRRLCRPIPSAAACSRRRAF